MEGKIRGAAEYCSKRAKKYLSRPYPQGAIDTDQLRSNITYVKVKDSENIVYRTGTNVEHAPYIEKGTKPHFPPLGDENEGLIRWVIRHMRARAGATPVFSGGKSKDRLAIARQIALNIAWKIYHHGTPPKPFLRPAFTEAKRKLIHDLEGMKK